MRLLCPLLSVLAGFSALPLDAEIEVRRDGENLEIRLDGRLFTEFRSDTWVPCLHPLTSPDGTHLTRRFPFEKGAEGEQPDHPHHIGFWFAHGDVNGHDFWHNRDGSKIVTKAFEGDPVIARDADGTEKVTFTANLEWVTGDGTRLLDETRTYTITAKPQTRTIDVTSELRAAADPVVFGDTKEGSFAIRVAPTLRHKGPVARGEITTSEGVTGGDAWGKRAKWVAYHGPNAVGAPTVVALLDHADNLRHPTWWHARDYGLLTANPFGPRSYKDGDFDGESEFSLEKGETLSQRYLLVLHQGDLGSAELDAQWKRFTRK